MPDRAASGASAGAAASERSIGDIIADTRGLTAEQVERILAYQKDKDVRFGEAAVALGYASTDDVLYALAQQFHYPYVSEERRKVSPELVVLNKPFSPQAEAFRAIRSQIIMRMYANPQVRRALAIVSPENGDGRTYFTANLGAALAQLGGRTLIVDADMRSPRIHEMFSLENNTGLSGILSGRAASQVIQQVVGVPSLLVLPIGITPPNPLELVERPAFGLLVRELIAKFDHVVVDTPATAHGADSAVISARCGSALVVARKHKAQVASLRDLVESLSTGPGAVEGVVLNDY